MSEANVEFLKEELVGLTLAAKHLEYSLDRAEKRGWADASQLVKIRELRNMIAHEYAAEKMLEIYSVVYQLATELLKVVPKVTHDAHALIHKYSH